MGFARPQSPPIQGLCLAGSGAEGPSPPHRAAQEAPPLPPLASPRRKPEKAEMRSPRAAMQQPVLLNIGQSASLPMLRTNFILHSIPFDSVPKFDGLLPALLMANGRDHGLTSRLPILCDVIARCRGQRVRSHGGHAHAAGARLAPRRHLRRRNAPSPLQRISSHLSLVSCFRLPCPRPASHEPIVWRLQDGAAFVDRDGKQFRHVLNWLRDGAVPMLAANEYQRLLREAEYYRMHVWMGLASCSPVLGVYRLSNHLTLSWYFRG